MVYVNINLVPMDGGHKSLGTGLVNYATLRAHHTPKTIREWAMRIDSLGVKRVGRWAIRRANLALLMSAGLERYRERLAIARARQAPPPSETHETSETHKSHHERLGEPRA